jgi:hypothetical protein
MHLYPIHTARYGEEYVIIILVDAEFPANGGRYVPEKAVEDYPG